MQSGMWNYLKDYSILWLIILGSLPFDMVVHYEIFMFQLTKVTAESHGPSLPHLVYGQPWTKPFLQDSVSFFWTGFPLLGRRQNLREGVSCVLNMMQERNPFTSALIVKLICVWMDASSVTTCTFTLICFLELLHMRGDPKKSDFL